MLTGYVCIGMQRSVYGWAVFSEAWCGRPVLPGLRGAEGEGVGWVTAMVNRLEVVAKMLLAENEDNNN